MGSWILQYLTPLDATATKLPRQLHGQPQRTVGPALPGNSTPTGLDKTASFVEGSNGDTAENWILNYLTPAGAMRAGAHLAQTIDQKGVLSKSAAGEAAASSLMFLPEGALARIFGKSNPAGRFTILTSENPGGAAASAEMNAARRASLEAELTRRGHKFTPVVGRYTDPSTGELLRENSYLIPGLSDKEAKALGGMFEQNGVITNAGYHDLVENQFFPSRGINAGTPTLHTELPGGERFALDIDWGSPQPSPTGGQLASVGVRGAGVQPLPPTPFSPALSDLLKEAAESSPSSNAARASARPLPTDMEIPTGIKKPLPDSLWALLRSGRP